MGINRMNKSYLMESIQEEKNSGGFTCLNILNMMNEIKCVDPLLEHVRFFTEDICRSGKNYFVFHFNLKGKRRVGCYFTHKTMWENMQRMRVRYERIMGKQIIEGSPIQMNSPTSFTIYDTQFGAKKVFDFMKMVDINYTGKVFGYMPDGEKFNIDELAKIIWDNPQTSENMDMFEFYAELKRLRENKAVLNKLEEVN